MSISTPEVFRMEYQTDRLNAGNKEQLSQPVETAEESRDVRQTIQASRILLPVPIVLLSGRRLVNPSDSLSRRFHLENASLLVSRSSPLFRQPPSAEQKAPNLRSTGHYLPWSFRSQHQSQQPKCLHLPTSPRPPRPRRSPLKNRPGGLSDRQQHQRQQRQHLQPQP